LIIVIHPDERAVAMNIKVLLTLGAALFSTAAFAQTSASSYNVTVTCN